MSKKFVFFLPFIFLFLVGGIPLLDLFQPGLPLTHDGRDHLARIASFYSALSDGVIIPRWGENLNWGYGHPVLMFLYPLPSYITSLFHFLGFSITDSLKIVFGLTFIVSGFGMFLWVRKLLNVPAGLLAAILYMFSPYRFVNLYVRGAIGEHVAFAFVPFILFFITKLFLDKEKGKIFFVINFIFISIFTAGLVLSHNALSILFLSFTIVYLLIIFYFKRNVIKLLVSSGALIYGFLLSAFFWLPAFIEGKYTLRDIVTGGSEYARRFVDPIKFILPDWSYGQTGELSNQIGIIHIALMLISVYAVFKLQKKDIFKKSVYLITLLFFMISLFMMTKESDFIWRIISTLQKFQFPWRFLSLTVLAGSLLGAYTILITNKRKKVITALVIITALIFFFYSSFWQAKDFLVAEDSVFEGVYKGTTDTGESAPVWSVRFMEKEPTAHIEVITGSALIQEISRSSIYHEYAFSSNEQVRVRENTLYFPGWNVYIDGKKLNVNSEIEFQDPAHRGVMTFFVDKGNHKIELIFEETRLRMISNIISLVSAVGLILIYPIYIFKFKNENS